MSATATASDAALTQRIFGPIFERRTYEHLGFLLLRLPVAFAAFALVATGLSVGLSLSVFLVGIPVLAGTLAAATYVGRLEAHLARSLLGVDIEYTTLDPTEVALVPYLKTAATSAHSYGMVAYCLASIFIAAVVFSALLTLISLSAVLLAAPLLYRIPNLDYQVGGLVGDPLVFVNSLPTALAASALGLACGVLTVHVVNALARTYGGFLVAILDGRGLRPPAATEN